MKSFLTPKCPVNADEQAWIDESMGWFVEQFGPQALQRPVILPTDEFFPGDYTGSDAEVREVIALMCTYLEVDPGRIDVELGTDYDDSPSAELRDAVPDLAYDNSGAAGHYHRRDGRGVITIARAQAEAPMALIATIAHELCHELLIGGGLAAPSRKDGEPLTDLWAQYLDTNPGTYLRKAMKYLRSSF